MVFPKFHAQNMAASSERLVSFSMFDTRDQFKEAKVSTQNVRMLGSRTIEYHVNIIFYPKYLPQLSSILEEINEPWIMSDQGLFIFIYF